MSVLTTKEIMEIIPHRQPFLLIDTIEELEPGKRAVGKKCVSYNEPFFGGHFPNEPVMPGVLIIEALAQTGAVAILSVEENRGKTAYFASILVSVFTGLLVSVVKAINIRMPASRTSANSCHGWNLYWQVPRRTGSS